MEPASFMDFDQASPADPDGSVGAIYLLYGGLMSTIQALEGSLASLVVAVEHDPTKGPKRWDKRVRKLHKRLWHVHRKASVSDKLSMLEGKVPEDLLSELKEFNKGRNFYAHRFFLERMESTGERKGRFARGTTADLFSFFNSTSKLLDRVAALETAIRASWPAPAEPVPAAFTEWAQDVAQLILRNRARPEVVADLRRRAAAKNAERASTGRPPRAPEV